jgi:hypothetical protein
VTNPTAGGSISGGKSYASIGANHTLTATPAKGYTFDRWATVGGGSMSNNTANPGTLSFNGDGGDVTVTAHFKTIATFVDETPPHILYWDSATNTMQLGHWAYSPSTIVVDQKKVTPDNILFFKFGGVIGAAGAISASITWAGMNMRFHPTGSTYKPTLPDVPYYGDINTGPGGTYNGLSNTGIVSNPGYHTLDNVRRGYGDPCKLAGITVSQIAAGIYDNGKYRMADVADYSSYSWVSAGTTTPSSSSDNNLYTGFAINSDRRYYMPCWGELATSGAANQQGNEMRYMTSTHRSGADPQIFASENSSQFIATSGTAGNKGYPVRCVPQ